jgi:hypothetical protein
MPVVLSSRPKETVINHFAFKSKLIPSLTALTVISVFIQAMVDELHKGNIHAMISIWPVFSKGTNTYALLHATGLCNNWRKDIQGELAFFLIRQAFAGQQRNA